MGSSWKAMADDNRRQMLLLLKDGEKTPTEMAKSFEFTLPAVSTHLRVLKGISLTNVK
jgi:DNA-binding transcriptional ArsR family regulator